MKLDDCPVCGARLVMPDILKRRVIKGRWADGRTTRTLVTVRCPKCPVTADVFEDTGVLICFAPNQPLKVRVAR
jgi:ribosomal protein S27E